MGPGTLLFYAWAPEEPRASGILPPLPTLNEAEGVEVDDDDADDDDDDDFIPTTHPELAS